MKDVAIEALLAALDHARIGVSISVARDGQLEPAYSNRVGASRLGYTVEELRAPWQETIAPHERPRALALLGRVLAGETAPAVLPLELLHRDGHVVPSELL